MYRPRFIANIELFLILSAVSLVAEDSTVTFGGATGWTPLSVSNALARARGQLGYEALVLDSSSANTSKAIDPETGDVAFSGEDRAEIGAFDSIYGGYGDSSRPAGKAKGRNSPYSDDLSLSFDGPSIIDETGNYSVVSSTFLHAGAKKARRGNGAALCNTSGAGLQLRGKSGSLFSSPGMSGSFTMDFWLFPAVTENGSVLFQWRSSRSGVSGSTYQYVRANVFKNHIEWDFSNIWVNSAKAPITVALAGTKNLVPGQWSHHELSYDGESGLLEYRVDGSTEDLRYVTSSGHERGDIYSALFGAPADIEIAPRFSGLIDEFRITRKSSPTGSLDRNRATLGKYPKEGGRFETMPLDTGGNESILKSLGAVTSCPPETGVAFFVRAGDNRYEWTDATPSWIPVKVGEALPPISGRYIQIAGELYSDGRGSASPTVTSVTLTYEKDTPPWPPARAYASPHDGSVTVTWPSSIDFDVAGYLVYYGERPGEYLGDGSPIDAGTSRSCTVTGLKNGRIYYFSVAAYDASGPRYPGPLSSEIYARPLAERQP